MKWSIQLDTGVDKATLKMFMYPPYTRNGKLRPGRLVIEDDTGAEIHKHQIDLTDIIEVLCKEEP